MNRREFLSVSGGALAAPTRRPNIILILADDLGYGDLSCYGGEVATPQIDRLAREGVRFTQAYVASPICSPSRVAITTGQYPARHLIFSYLDSRARNRALGMRDYLDPNAPSMARAFQRAGYATAHFGKWHMGGGRDVGDAPLPREYGFDESLTSFEGLGDRVLPPGRLSEMSAWLGRGNISRAPQNELTRLYVDRSIDFMKRNADRPFFLNLWPNDVHDPFAPKPELMEKHRRHAANKYMQQFAATLDEMDRQIGRVIDAVDALGMADRTMIVFMGDNGPTAWPYYYKEGLEPPGSTGGLRGRKWSLYEGGVREPLIVRWKGSAPAGRVDRDTVACATDLFPTFCRVAGVDVTGIAFDGEDISRAFLGRPHRRRGDILWEYGRNAAYLRPGREEDRSPNLAIRSGSWKALVNDDRSRLELYNLECSAVERENIALSRPDIARRLSERVIEWRESLPTLQP
ncbi:MAG TPA: sulfatase-like hydrolase/transferase [Bryobacteraceae bacterium]|nr:sulfatase-like hydrolase/transferase [Bryobacteraceae bacterium]